MVLNKNYISWVQKIETERKVEKDVPKNNCSKINIQCLHIHKHNRIKSIKEKETYFSKTIQFNVGLSTKYKGKFTVMLIKHSFMKILKGLLKNLKLIFTFTFEIKKLDFW